MSYNGSGAEPGVLMLKRYIGYHFRKDSKRLWEFRYKLQYEEPRVNVVNSSSDEDTLLLTWNKDYVQPERVVIDFMILS